MVFSWFSHGCTSPNFIFGLVRPKPQYFEPETVRGVSFLWFSDGGTSEKFIFRPCSAALKAALKFVPVASLTQTWQGAHQPMNFCICTARAGPLPAPVPRCSALPVCEAPVSMCTMCMCASCACTPGRVLTSLHCGCAQSSGFCGRSGLGSASTCICVDICRLHIKDTHSSTCNHDFEVSLFAFDGVQIASVAPVASGIHATNVLHGGGYRKKTLPSPRPRSCIQTQHIVSQMDMHAAVGHCRG